MKIERLPSGRDFVDNKGNVRHVSDLTPDMEPIGWGNAADSTAVRGLSSVRRRGSRSSRRGGRSYTEISGRDIGQVIDDALAAESDKLGRALTEDEIAHTAHLAERRARGFQD